MSSAERNDEWLAADGTVHSARVATTGARVAARFTVSDRLGRKLDATAEARVRAALSGERVAPRRLARATR